MYIYIFYIYIFWEKEKNKNKKQRGQISSIIKMIEQFRRVEMEIASSPRLKDSTGWSAFGPTNRRISS